MSVCVLRYMHLSRMWKQKACAFRFRSFSLERHPTLNSRTERELFRLLSKAIEIATNSLVRSEQVEEQDPSGWIPNATALSFSSSCMFSVRSTLFCFILHCVYTNSRILCVLGPPISPFLLFPFAIFSLLGVWSQ